jgi:hypothetical protein
LAWIRSYLAERERLVTVVASLKDYPRGRANVILDPVLMNTLLPHNNDCRAVVYLLDLDSERILHSERPTGALDRIQSMLHVGAAVRDEPFAISQILRIAIHAVAVRSIERLLGMAVPTDDDLRKLADQLTAERGEDLVSPAIRGERAGHNRQFDDIESGKIDFADFIAKISDTKQLPTLQLRIGALLYRPRWYEDHARLLRQFNECERIAKLPFWEQSVEWARFHDEMLAAKAQGDREKRWIYSVLLMPAVNKIAGAAERDNALISCMLTALAAERFRLANQRWPDKLDELCPQFLSKVPTDSYDGEPLRLAKRDDGIVIYSVGEDGGDNGGERLTPSASPTEPSDLGIRLWNPDHRRLPPEAKKSQNPDG